MLPFTTAQRNERDPGTSGRRRSQTFFAEWDILGHFGTLHLKLARSATWRKEDSAEGCESEEQFGQNFDFVVWVAESPKEPTPRDQNFGQAKPHPQFFNDSPCSLSPSRRKHSCHDQETPHPNTMGEIDSQTSDCPAAARGQANQSGPFQAK